MVSFRIKSVVRLFQFKIYVKTSTSQLKIFLHSQGRNGCRHPKARKKSISCLKGDKMNKRVWKLVKTNAQIRTQIKDWVNII